MAPGIFGRLFGGMAREEEKRKMAQEERRKEQWRRASVAGPPGALASLNPLSLGGRDWQLERDRRRRGVREQYKSDRKVLINQRRQAERELKEDLRRQQKSIEGYYKRKEGRLGVERAQERVGERFGQVEREMSRKFDREWQAREHDLARSRNEQYRAVTESMKRESRQARRLVDRQAGYVPGETPLPRN